MNLEWTRECSGYSRYTFSRRSFDRVNIIKNASSWFYNCKWVGYNWITTLAWKDPIIIMVNWWFRNDRKVVLEVFHRRKYDVCMAARCEVCDKDVMPEEIVSEPRGSSRLGERWACEVIAQILPYRVCQTRGFIWATRQESTKKRRKKKEPHSCTRLCPLPI